MFSMISNACYSVLCSPASGGQESGFHTNFEHKFGYMRRYTVQPSQCHARFRSSVSIQMHAVLCCAAQPVACWRQQDSLMGQGTFTRTIGGQRMQFSDPALPVSVSLTIIQAPAAYFRPIVQKKPFKPPFTVGLLSACCPCIPFCITLPKTPEHPVMVRLLVP